MHWIICPLILMAPLLSISVTSLADVDAVYSWVQKSQIDSEPNTTSTWIPLVGRPSIVSSGTIIFSTNPSYSDGVKWNG